MHAGQLSEVEESIKELKKKYIDTDAELLDLKTKISVAPPPAQTSGKQRYVQHD